MTMQSYEIEVDPALLGGRSSPDTKMCGVDGCTKMVTPRGRQRHINSAHADSDSAKGTKEKAQRRLGGGRTRKNKGLTQDVSDGLASFAGKILFLVTLIFAWSALRRAHIADPHGDLADTMAMTDDEATAIGRVLARVFASTDTGRRIAPKIVENEDIIDAAFAGWEWYQRNAKMWDELRGDVRPDTMGETAREVTFSEERMSTNGSNGQATRDRSESEGSFGYFGPASPSELLS